MRNGIVQNKLTAQSLFLEMTVTGLVPLSNPRAKLLRHLPTLLRLNEHPLFYPPLWLHLDETPTRDCLF